jgi:hypothetical protein
MKSRARRPRCIVGNERGMALPMTMIVLTLITTLALAFLALAATEPIIANNHMASAQARAMAESGIERALWALSTGAVPDPLLNAVADGPYDGASANFIAMNAKGGFTVRIENGPAVNERTIIAVGYVPTTTTAGYVPNATNFAARREIRLTATRFRKLDPPCAICAGGEQPSGAYTDIRIGGSAQVRASEATGAQFCGDAPLPQAAAISQGSVSMNGTPDLAAPPGGQSSIENGGSALSGMIFSNDEMAMLRDMAKATGTYLKGEQSYTFSEPPPNGIIFIDTPSGNPFSQNSPSSDIVNVDIHGNWSQGWSGWLIVAGSVQVSGNVAMTGLLYAQNDVILRGTGNSGFTGAVISTNRMDTLSSRVADGEDIGNAPITYSCPAVRDGGGTITQRWFTKPGTFREVGA